MGGIENKVKDIEEKLKDSDVSQKDVDDINKLSTDKKGAEALRTFLDTQENQDLINKLICDAFDKCALDKQTGNIRMKFKNSIENINKDKKFDNLIADLQTKIDDFQGTIDQNDTKIAQENTAKVEKLNKEQAQKELSTYLNIMPSKEDDINKMASGLFETNEARFNALFDADLVVTPTQKDNLTKYVQTYLNAKDLTFDKIQFLTTTKDKPQDTKTQVKSDKYPIGTYMIKIEGNTEAEIVFGTQDQAQIRISEAYIKANPKSISDLGSQITNGENNEYIVNELNEKGSYITLAKIIENKPEAIATLLTNGFVESLMKSGNKLEEANKKISTENLKPENANNQKPLLNETSLKDILDQQRDGYLNVINNAVLNIMKQPNITVSSPERSMFQTYMQSCNKDPRVLGATVDQRITSWNNIADRYKTFQSKNQIFFTDVTSSSLSDIANRPNNTELALHKAINNDFNALWIHIKGEGNEKYGLKAQMKGLFESFKDEILMIAEFLGFDKEKIMHRCGFNKELKDQMTKFFKEKYELTGDQIKDINKLSTDNADLVNDIKTIAKNGATEDGKIKEFASSKEAIIAFRNSEDIRNTYLNSLKTITPNGDFIKTLISQYNTTQKNENDHINYLDYVTKVNKNGKDTFEPTKGKRENLVENYGTKLRNLDFIWDNIATASANLKDMTASERNGKGSESKTPEMANMVLEKIQEEKGSNTNEDMLLGVSYYLSSMIIGGHDKLEYTISENNDKKPTTTDNNNTTTVEKPKETPKITIDKTLATEKDGVYTITTEGAKKKIHEIFADFTKAPELIVVHDKETNKDITATKSKEGTQDTYIDITNNTRVKISAGDTIKEASQDQIDSYEGEIKVNKTITEVKDWVTKADKTAGDYKKNYIDKVTKPIFDLFTAKNTYNYMHDHDTEDQTIIDPKSLNALMAHSYHVFNPNTKTPFIDLNIDKAVIKNKNESIDNKITFEVTEKEVTRPRIFTIDNTGKFEEHKTTKDKNPTTVDYTSTTTFRKSLGFTGSEVPKDYETRLETEFLKDGLTEPQKTTIAKEIARTFVKANIERNQKIGIKFDIKTEKVNASLRDGKVIDGGKLSGDVRKIDDTKVSIELVGGNPSPFKIEAKIDELLA